MELGTAKLRKVGINNLHCAVHPQHGVIWTDGSAIYLAPIHVQGHHVQNATSVRLGQFEHVTSVHWSSPGTSAPSAPSTPRDGESSSNSSSGGAPPCHLCVVHQQNVTVWRVSGALPRLSFKQVRKINVRPVPQGCLWHPANDVLCLLSRHQCSFYFRHDQNKGSYAFPSLESGKISCGCWSPDGKKLLLCIGTALLIYRWDDVGNAIGDFSASAWRIPGLEGQVTSIAPVSKDSVVVATEIPLETLCKQQDLFTVRDINSNQSPDGVIRPKGSASASLMNLQRNEQAASEGRSSSLVLVQLPDVSGDPTKLSSVPLKGVVTPDILLYENHSQCVVVGSNTQSQIHIYALLENNLAYCGDVQLDKGQRPKGLCSMPSVVEEKGAALLILVGQREVEESPGLSPSTECDFRLSLKYIILKSGHDHRAKNNARGAAHKARGSQEGGAGAGKSPHGLVKSESMKEHGLLHKSVGAVEHHQRGVRRGRSGSVKNDLPGLTSKRASTPGEVLTPISQTEEDARHEPELLLKRPQPEAAAQKGKMVEELTSASSPVTDGNSPEVETVDFSSQPPSFGNEKLSNLYELQQPAHSGKSSGESRKERRKGGSSPRENGELPGITADKLAREKISAVEAGKSVESKDPSNSFHAESSRIGESQAGGIAQSNSPLSSPRQNGQATVLTDIVGKARRSASEVGSATSTLSDSGIVTRSSSGSVSSTHTGSLSPSPRHMPGLAEDGHRSPYPGEPATDGGGGAGAGGDGCWDEGLGGSIRGTDSGFASVERQVKSQKSSIESLQQRLQQLAMTVEETSCVFPTKYQELTKPEMIKVVCRRSGSASEAKTFLLDNGRLKLDSVQLAFGLSVVELWLDDIPCVLSANVDGYIPIKFSPSSTLHITGLPCDTQHREPDLV